MTTKTEISFEVAYTPQDGPQFLATYTWPSASSNHKLDIKTALEYSQLFQQYPLLAKKISNGDYKVGIFSRIKELDHIVKHHDRIEIYYPLPKDPKAMRHERIQREK